MYSASRNAGVQGAIRRRALRCFAHMACAHLTLAAFLLFPVVAVADPAPPNSAQEGALTNWDDPDGTLTTDAAYLDGNVLTSAGRTTAQQLY